MDQSQTKLIAQVKLVFLGSQNVLSKTLDEKMDLLG